MLAELSAKRLQLLKDAMPRLARVAVLWNPPTAYHAKAIENLKVTAPSAPRGTLRGGLSAFLLIERPS